ncbi:putative transporter YvbV [Weizmannia acidilactici]|uniref:Transporter YvbV n=2 Tax=Weizmannia acidilactici TaxID=2607726 RepID=A0A5J4JK04_9BACI|nr:putative transporter YvbV [Weizmannia acidilactici]GER71539.1 putative transporter YvbV [Weizmannia acidilactici]GER73611.1 putative transporter YvbV [Weizmannia acidilactici]
MIRMRNGAKIKTAFYIAYVVIIWGMCWPVYKYALAYTPPLLFAGIRTLLGGVLLALFLVPQWQKIEWRKNWKIYCIVGFFNTVIFNGVQTIGLEYMASGLFSVIVYLQPVLVSVFAWLWLKESMSFLKIAGLLIGFLGVAAVCRDGFTGKVSAIGIILALITSVGWAFGIVYMKKTSTQVHGLWLVALQSILGGLFLTGAGFLKENISDITWNLPYIACLLFGGVLGMAVATTLYFKLMNTGDASKVASFTFLVPLIAVGIGTLFLGEPFTFSLLEGLVLILISIYLTNHPSKNFIRKKKVHAEIN